jgi:cell division protein FtsB
MTIIQPNKYQNIKRLTIILSSILIGVVVFGVFLYLQTVNAKHDLTKMKQELENMRVQNAELKEKYYSLVDATSLEQLAEERGLIQDKNPQWAFASHL